MPYAQTTKEDIQKLLYHDITPSFMSDTEWYISLYTDNPGSTGDQSTNEVTYTWYARVPVIRSDAGWELLGSVINNATLIQFWKRTNAWSLIATHWAIGRTLTWAGQIIQYNALADALPIAQNITPQIAVWDIDLNITP
jgi:hypothetical protein